MLIGCRISFLTTSSSEIEVCFFFAVRIGPSVVGDVKAAAVSLCQTCFFGNKRYKMLVQKVCAKKNPSKLSDLPHVLEKYQGREYELYNQVCEKYQVSQLRSHKKYRLHCLIYLASKRCVELCGCLDDLVCWTCAHSLLSFHFHRGQLHWCVFLSLLRHCVRFSFFHMQPVPIADP